MANDDAPSHIQGLPRLADADFIYAGYDGETVQEYHDAAIELFAEIDAREGAESTRYFVLGSYDTPDGERDGPRDRLVQVRNAIDEHAGDTTAFLLDELDETAENWANFYLKFRYTLLGTDYSLLVAEDNDGGHELELGEVALETTYVLKRDYRSLSLDSDLEHEKFDAMMATLFDVLEDNDRLLYWTSVDELEACVVRVIGRTT